MKAALIILLLMVSAEAIPADAWLYWIDPAISTPFSRLKRT